MDLLSRAPRSGVMEFASASQHAEQAVPFLSPSTLAPPTVDVIAVADVGTDVGRLSAGLDRPARRGGRIDAGAPPRVLLIDDQLRSDSGLVALVKLLELDGFDVWCVQSAADGLRRALARGHDVIVLDLKLPDRPGLWVLEEFRASGFDIPVVVITGCYLEEGDERAARVLGVYDYVRKPVFADDLAPLLWQAVGGRDAWTGTLSDRGTASRLAGSAAEAGEAPPPVDSDAAGGPVGDENGRYGPGSNRFASTHFHRLQRLLRGAFPQISEDSITSAIDTALMDYLERVRRGDPPPAEAVEGYLYTAAKRNVIDIRRAETRRHLREDRYSKDAPLVAEPPATAFARESTDIRRWIRALASNQAEERALILWAEGAEAERIADALGCSHLAAVDQRAEVKRFKDRIRRRARRSRR